MAYRNYYKGKSKYHAKKTEVDGILFDSKRESERYQELKILERAGEIKDLILQPSFVVIPAYWETYERYGKNGNRLKDGKRCLEHQCVYRADFAYIDKNGNKVVEDVKGIRTEAYKIKKKLMLQVYGIQIKEVE